MFKAAIFDMDGTMVDTEIIQSRAFEAVLAEFGVTAELTEHGTVQIPGRTSKQMWEFLKQKHHITAEVDDLTAMKRAAAMEALQEDLEPMPGLLELLFDLKQQDIKLAVATSSLRDRAELIMDKIGVSDHFHASVTAAEITNVKPEPDVYLEAARALDIAPAECIAFEDTDVGIVAAKAAGMKVVAVPNEYTKRMDFSRADLTVTSLEDVTFEQLINL
jgi:HAD superfamily hydrolase (TIGR01509 family)